ncbi:MAG TPA: methyltransferase domain-containing protein [Pyrinomonadaceae bacterium]|nr:methyltransferase domain-containing protein [Pyrinomonadaceae bacterium]
MTRPVYDDIAPHYEKVMRPLQRWFLLRLRAETLSQLPENARILEVGAGTGLNFIFYPAGASGVASEFSHEMLRIAARKDKPSAVSLVENCAEFLPFRDHSFDAAFATLVFCSIHSPAQAFAELRRVVKPGGKVILLEHVRPRGLLGPFFDFLNFFTLRLFNDHFNRRTAKDAQQAGLTIIRVDQHLGGIINLIACRV